MVFLLSRMLIVIRSVQDELSYLVGLKFISDQCFNQIMHYRTKSRQFELFVENSINSCSSSDPDANNSLELQISVIDSELKALQKSIYRQLEYSLTKLSELEESCKPVAGTASRSICPSADMMQDMLQRSSSSLSLATSVPVDPRGLLARVAAEFLQLPPSNNSPSSLLSDAVEYIESPIEKMKRAGLNLLSKGLGG